MSNIKPLHIAVLIMTKNEKKRLHVTLESVKDFADSIIMYDTGSSDNTIEIAQTFCEKHNIIFRLKQGEFVDFATSRNVALDFADSFEDVSYILLCDVNDELRNGSELRKFAKEMLNKPNTGFLVCQEWWSGQYEKYYNVRFVKAHEGWRYRGRIHEWMKNTKYPNDEEAAKEGVIVWKISPEQCILYQDRTQDDDKTKHRFAKDKELLLQDHYDNPSDPRTVFYLAQTCSCLNHLEDAFYYYKIRSTLEGFKEEKFHAFLRAGDISKTLGHPWHDTMAWYMKAFEEYPRAEPIVQICDHYRQQKNWLIAYTFADLACKLPYPEQLILFVDKYAYDYKRWHLLGIVGYYAGFYNEGKIACLKAIETGLQKEVDERNLKFYEEKEFRLKPANTQRIQTKKEFMDQYIMELSKTNPNLTKKQLVSKANMKWKAGKNRVP